MPEFLAEREAQRLARLEIEKERAWLWFTGTGPPTVENCADVPELEKAKFAYQCAPRQNNADVVALFEGELARIRDQRDRLSARVEIVRKDYERLTAREASLGRSSPDMSAQIAGLEGLLDKLDAVTLRGDVMRRFVMELERNRDLDLGQVARIAFDEAPPALPLSSGPEPTSDPVGQTNGGGDIVIVIDTLEATQDTIMLVHEGFGLVYANKTDFYAR
ncbi:MAG: hypothetical protein AAGI13_00755 [Pseudomonadota bacterium]